VVKVSPTLTTVVDLFTPNNQSGLDQSDADFVSAASAGVARSAWSGATSGGLAVGKVGTMYFMNEDSLGGYSPSTNNVLGSYVVGGCWCGPSYFVDPTDGLGRVVSSGGKSITIWKVQNFSERGIEEGGCVSGAWELRCRIRDSSLRFLRTGRRIRSFGPSLVPRINQGTDQFAGFQS